MASKHGTQTRYTQGCRCEDCIAGHRVYQRNYRERKANGDVTPRAAVVAFTAPQDAEVQGVGRVERGVEAEISGLAQAEARPGLAQMALELARVMDNPRALNQKAAASKALAEVLDKLRKGADVRKSRLASVRGMTGGAGKAATG